MKQYIQNVATQLNTHLAGVFGGVVFAEEIQQGVYHTLQNQPLAFDDSRAPFCYLRQSGNVSYDENQRGSSRGLRMRVPLRLVAIQRNSVNAAQMEQTLLHRFHFFNLQAAEGVSEPKLVVVGSNTTYNEVYYDEFGSYPLTQTVSIAAIDFIVTADLLPCALSNINLLGVCQVIDTVDTDVTAFCTAAGIVDATQISALDTLVKGLKSALLWDKMHALYPMVGGTGQTHKLNLKNPQDTNAAYRLNFVGSWAHTTTGAKPSIGGYANTNYVSSTANPQGLTSTHISIYSRTNNTTNGVDFGAYTRQAGSGAIVDALNFTCYYGGRVYLGSHSSNTDAGAAILPTTGLYVLNRTTNAGVQLYRRGTANWNTALSSQLLCNAPLYLGARNDNGVPMFTSEREIAFASIGLGLSGLEVTTFTQLVDAFQTALNRNI